MSENLAAADLLKRSMDAFLAKDMRAWADLCDENVVVEFPFAPEGSPSRLEGRDAIYEYLRGYPDLIDIHSITSLEIHSTGDPDTAIADWSVTGRVLANGNPYNMSYATFVTFKDGKVAKYREYWNPLAFLKALGGESF
ncbi:nuclear transport factor 2 family protein [Streptomyces sp. NPDC091215]|uniref:nuclear transport factor 2 family protein n=1 Tax=Streptomyces sp. NPDC091215 TaxID=3155192 RepID=UPI003440C160